MKPIRYGVILFLSFLIGTTMGEILRLLLPEKFSTMAIFTNGWMTVFPDLHLNLRVINFQIGLGLLINTFSWIGLLLSTFFLLIQEIFTK
ncbi:MAG: hypothetical protein N2115_02300 [bacterium]|nr:hypothetical protein [bacterium]